MKKKKKEKTDSKELTDVSFPFHNILSPIKALDGKWYFPVNWGITNEEPAAIFGNEKWLLEHLPCYQHKSIDDVISDLVQKQMENDKEKTNVLTSLCPDDIGQSELDELAHFEEEDDDDDENEEDNE